MVVGEEVKENGFPKKRDTGTVQTSCMREGDNCFPVTKCKIVSDWLPA